MSIPVCSCGNYSTAGCEHTRPVQPHRRPLHRCPLPPNNIWHQPWRRDWECGICGRVFHEDGLTSGVRWWSEIRGPS